MNTLRTVYAIVPVASGVNSVVAAYKALPLAERSRLHMSPPAVTYGLITDIALTSFIEAQVEACKEEQEKAAAAFRQACQQVGIESEWRADQCLDYLVSAHAGSRARAADLVIFSRAG